jgi:hypothetical protein
MPLSNSFVTSSAESILNDNTDCRWGCFETDRNTQERTPNEFDKNFRVVDLTERGCQLFDVDDADTVVGDHIDELFVESPTFQERY